MTTDVERWSARKNGGNKKGMVSYVTFGECGTEGVSKEAQQLDVTTYRDV